LTSPQACGAHRICATCDAVGVDQSSPHVADVKKNPHHHRISGS